MTQISSAPAMQRAAYPGQRLIASSSEPATSAPSAQKALSRVTTMFSRPGSGRPMLSQVLRPMMTGLPIVSALKRFRSLESRQGSPSRVR